MSGPHAVVAFAPGRVNLIGDHTDYTGGYCLPMAVHLGTEVAFTPTTAGADFDVTSLDEPAPAFLPALLARGLGDPSMAEPTWARYVAGAVALAKPRTGGRLEIASTLPIAAGLSSSTALVVATTLALGGRETTAAAEDPGGGDEVSVRSLALACQRAEEAASGVPGGLLDQLAIIAARPGHALLLDCGRVRWSPVEVPEAAEFLVVDSGEPRRLAGSQYAVRRAECDEAAALLGPLSDATLADVGAVDDPLLRRRARHVVTENARTAAMAAALAAGDLARCGQLMDESHRSLAEDFDVSTERLDDLVASLHRVPGVLGARLTGAGFGGCVVALAEQGTGLPDGLAPRWWRVRAAGGARRRAG